MKAKAKESISTHAKMTCWREGLIVIAPETERFGRTDPGSHFHYGSLRHSSHSHFRDLFFFHCFALTRRDTAAALGQLRILLPKRKETTVGLTGTPASGLTEFHQKLFK